MENKTIHILNNLHFNRVEREGNTLKVEGYACHFNVRNHNGEIVTAESFGNWLDEMSEGGQKPVFNYNHDNNRVIGGWDSIEADETGLLVRGHINTDVAFVRDELLPLIEAGDLSHLSTEGWACGEYDEKQNAYVCDQFQLTAIALVALPADFAAKADIHNKLRKPEGETPKKQRYGKLIY